jgi:cell division protein FtsZ
MLSNTSKTVIVGIGGAGGNMVNNFVRSKEIDCHTISANTDSQALELSMTDEKFLFEGTRGLGLGGKMSAGAQIGELNREEFLRRISGYDTIIICAGLGGGTGSGVTGVLAKAAMDAGLNVLCFCTLPFHFEKEKRRSVAIAALNEIQSLGVWTEIFDNQKLFGIAKDETTFAEAFRIVDQHFISLIHEAAANGFDRQSFDLSRCKVS